MTNYYGFLYCLDTYVHPSPREMQDVLSVNHRNETYVHSVICWPAAIFISLLFLEFAKRIHENLEATNVQPPDSGFSQWPGWAGCHYWCHSVE